MTKKRSKEVINKRTKIAMVIAILVMFLSIIGTTLAFFTATVTGNDENTSVITKTATLGLHYETGNMINMSKAMPGWSGTKTFTVENIGTLEVSYSINIREVINTFTERGDLVYTLSGDKIKGETPMPASDASIYERILIEPGEIHEYELTITYINREYIQDIDQGKVFSGKIVIEEEGINYTEIYTAEDLNNVRNNLSGNYLVMQDIDMSSYPNFEPIGSLSEPFTGILNGQDYEITNLTINRPTEDNVGLFSSISNSLIKNTELTNASIIGQNNVGGLVALIAPMDNNAIAINNNKVSNSVITGQTGSAGGLIGTVTKNGTIENNNIAIDSNEVLNTSISLTAGNNIGGLIATLRLGTVTNNHISAAIDSENSANVGGLIGIVSPIYTDNAVSIKNNETNGNTKGRTSVGGLIGSLLFDTSIANDNVTVEQNIVKNHSVSTYSSNTAGGLIGFAQAGKIKQNYIEADIYCGSSTGTSFCGGLVGSIGINWDTSKIIIEENYATSTIEGERIGGLIGIMYTIVVNTETMQIKNNIAQGNLKSIANNYVGGNTGRIYLNNISNSMKINYENNIVFNTFGGTIGNPSGFIGTQDAAIGLTVTYSNNFWDITTSENNKPINNSTATVTGITGKTTTQLKTTSTYSGWDTSIWNFTAGQYPTLKNVPYPN